jgi:hypothetical protein
VVRLRTVCQPRSIMTPTLLPDLQTEAFEAAGSARGTDRRHVQRTGKHGLSWTPVPSWPTAYPRRSLFTSAA